MTEEQLDLLYNLKNKYYHAHAKLIAAVIEQAPKELQSNLLDILGESSSVYGSRYNEYIGTPNKKAHALIGAINE